jgi:hypothetical protein
VVAFASRLGRLALAAAHLGEQPEKAVELRTPQPVVERELVALPVVDRARVDAPELVGEEGGHLALVEVRRRVVEPAREIHWDVAAAISHDLHP